MYSFRCHRARHTKYETLHIVLATDGDIGRSAAKLLHEKSSITFEQ